MSDKVNILFVEDDPYLGPIIKDLLSHEGFEISHFKTAESAYSTFNKSRYDLCLLDVMLPGMNGFELGKKIRIIDKRIPILFLTAKSQQEDVIEGFESGADDYLKKPFSMQELVLRIKALLRRNSLDFGLSKEIIEYAFGKYVFNHPNMTLYYDNETHKLTHRESEMLKLLCENKNILVERDLILDQVWGDDSYFNARSMDVFLAKLRKHFKDEPNVSIINIRGRGFKLLVQ